MNNIVLTRNFKHLMTGTKGNSEFCLSETLNNTLSEAKYPNTLIVSLWLYCKLYKKNKKYIKNI